MGNESTKAQKALDKCKFAVTNLNKKEGEAYMEQWIDTEWGQDGLV